MSMPYFPMFPADFEADTSHLTLEEDGAYNRLLRLCWMAPGCSLPDDDAWIMRRMRVDAETFSRVVAPVIEEFFHRRAGRITNQRLRAEWEKADETYRRRSEAGKKGGRPKAIENKGNDEKAGLSNAKAGLTKPEPEPYREKEEPNGSSKKRGSRLRGDWVLPMAWGRWAVEFGLTEAETRSEADKFRDYWQALAGAKAVKLDWEKTWHNWVRRYVEGRKASGKPVGQPKYGDVRQLPDGRHQTYDPAMGGWVAYHV